MIKGSVSGLMFVFLGMSFSLAAFAAEGEKVQCALASAPGGKAYGQVVQTSIVDLVSGAGAPFSYGSFGYTIEGNNLSVIINRFADKTYKASVVVGTTDNSIPARTVMTAEPLAGKIDIEFPFTGIGYHLLCK